MKPMEKIIDCIWFNLVGIVKVQDLVTKELKFYIGYGQGFDIKEDEKYIADYGNRIYPEIMEKYFK